jgi:ribosomal protein L37AE/L43A
MSRIRSRLTRLEKMTAERPACRVCSLEGPMTFTVVAPRVVGEDEHEPEVELPDPPPCPACGRPRPRLRFDVQAPHPLAGA